MITVKEYLIENKTTLNNGLPIELRDILNDGGAYYGGGYRQLMEEQPQNIQILNSRYIYEDFESENDCIVLCYMQDVTDYPIEKLWQVAKLMKNKTIGKK